MDPLRLLVVSDIHSNHAALRAVLDEAAPWDLYICAGDTVGYGPDPNECVGALRGNGFRYIMGNHDREVITGDNLAGGSPRKLPLQPPGGQRHRDQPGPPQPWFEGVSRGLADLSEAQDRRRWPRCLPR